MFLAGFFSRRSVKRFILIFVSHIHLEWFIEDCKSEPKSDEHLLQNENYKYNER